MTSDAKRLGWKWVVVSVDPDGRILVLDPKKARRGQEIRLSKGAIIENLTAWL